MVQQLNNKYIFFDRDGTLNIDTGYVSSVEDFILYDDVFQSLSLLSKKNFLFILTTNQSGINRGFLDFEKLNQIHKKLDELLSAKEIKFKDKFFCPHLPTQDCSCRKPQIGMFLKASQKHNIDLKNSIVIGDSDVDVIVAKKIGALSILVKTGNGLKSIKKLKKKNIKPDFIGENLLECALFLTEGSA